MNGRQAKRLRAYAEKRTIRNMRAFMDQLGAAPFRVRLDFAWAILRGKRKRARA